MKRAKIFIDGLVACRNRWFEIIDRSFLCDVLKSSYKSLIDERLHRLDTSNCGS